MNAILEIFDMEHKIKSIIKNDNNSQCIFDYNENSLKIYTKNPLHLEMFLMVDIEGPTKMKCLENALSYLKKKVKKSTYYTYSVEWVKCGQMTKHTSYFWVRNMTELLEKFYDGDKNEHDYIIYTISLRPEN